MHQLDCMGDLLDKSAHFNIGMVIPLETCIEQLSEIAQVLLCDCFMLERQQQQQQLERGHEHADLVGR